MRRQSDIGWTELILGIVLIILGIFIIKQPVGIITWIVVLCGLIAVFSGIADIVLYVKMERFTGFETDHFPCDWNSGCHGRFYADGTSECRNLGDRNDPSDLDHCTLYFQTFASAVYEDAFWKYLLHTFPDPEYSWADRRDYAGVPADGHDSFHGSAGWLLSDP